MAEPTLRRFEGGKLKLQSRYGNHMIYLGNEKVQIVDSPDGPVKKVTPPFSVKFNNHQLFCSDPVVAKHLVSHPLFQYADRGFIVLEFCLPGELRAEWNKLDKEQKRTAVLTLLDDKTPLKALREAGWEKPKGKPGRPPKEKEEAPAGAPDLACQEDGCEMVARSGSQEQNEHLMRVHLQVAHGEGGDD